MDNSLSRRALLLGLSGAGLGGIGLSGCTERVETSGPASTPPMGQPPSATATPTPSPAPSPTPAVPTRGEIVARFGDRRPTEWSSGEFEPMKGVLRHTKSDKVALTFDACGGPGGSGTDQRILDVLRKERIPAVMFLNKRWIEKNPAEFDKLAGEQDLFDIGNHGTRHTPLSVTGRSQFKEPGTKNAGEVYDEIMDNQAYLTDLLGKAPKFFRTGTGYYDEVAVDIIHALGLVTVGLDTNADAGTTYSTQQTITETAKAKPGAIVMCHFNQPKRASGAAFPVVLPKMRERGVEFAKLSELPYD